MAQRRWKNAAIKCKHVRVCNYMNYEYMASDVLTFF
jgi:hypothetical protein